MRRRTDCSASGSATPTIGAGLLVVAAFVAAAVSLSTGAGSWAQSGPRAGDREHAVDIDGPALAGAQARLAAIAAGMGLPVQALAPGPAVPVVFAPTTPGVVRDLGRSAGLRRWCADQDDPH